MKKSVLVVSVLLLLIAAPTFAATRTTSVSFGIGGYTATNIANGEGVTSTGMAFRYVTSPGDVGFYFGVDVFSGIAIAEFDWDFSPFDISFQFADFSNTLMFNMDFRMPFGYRFAAEGKGSGFYIGGGPEADIFFPGGMLFVGGFFELGWQTNRTEGIGFHFGMLIGYTPLIYEIGGSADFYFFNPMLVHPTLEFGVSWRRVKGQSAAAE